MLTFFYYKYTKFPCFRINGKDIVLGTIHINSYKFLHPKIEQELNECTEAYIEGKYGIKSEEFSVEIVNNLNNSLEDKIINLCKYMTTNNVETNYLYYNQTFIDKLPDKTIDALECQLAILMEYTIDNYIFHKFRKNCKFLDDTEIDIEIDSFSLILVILFFYFFVILKYIYHMKCDFLLIDDLSISNPFSSFFEFLLFFTPEKMKKKFLYERNEIFLSKIKTCLENSDKYIIAMGIAHTHDIINELKKNNIVEKFSYETEEWISIN